MVASRHADVDDLNSRARQRLAAAGALGDEVVIGDRPFAVGDDVLATRNDYRVMIFNGTRATIIRIDADQRCIVVEDTRRRPLVIPFAYADAGHLTWGYASTLHKAQGATVNQTFLLADDTLYRERSYTGLSRGTEANDVYLAVPDDEQHGAPGIDDPIERLRKALNRSEAKSLALQDPLSPPSAAGRQIEQLTAPQRRLAPIVNRHRRVDSLVAEHHRLREPIAQPPELGRGIRRSLGIDPGL